MANPLTSNLRQDKMIQKDKLPSGTAPQTRFILKEGRNVNNSPFGKGPSSGLNAQR